MQSKKYSAGSIIYFSGDIADKIYILKSGKAQSIFISEETGVEDREIVNVGEFFGVKSILGSYPQEDTVQCITNCEILVISYEEFESLIEKNKQIIIKMLRVFSNQLRRINKKVNLLMGTDSNNDDNNAILEGFYNIGEFYFKNKSFKSALYAYKRYFENANENDSAYHTVQKKIEECKKELKIDDINISSSGNNNTKEYDTGDIIFLEFERADKFYMVQSGSVKIIKLVKDVEKLLDIVYSNNFFGEMAILEDTIRSASAIANEPTVLLELKKENFQSILANNMSMGLKLSKMFAKRIFDSKRRLLILQLKEPELRVYDSLLLIAEIQNIDIESYDKTHELTTNINDISNWCGLKTTDVQRILNNLQKASRIEIKQNTIVVKGLNEFKRQVDVKRKKPGHH